MSDERGMVGLSQAVDGITKRVRGEDETWSEVCRVRLPAALPLLVSVCNALIEANREMSTRHRQMRVTADEDHIYIWLAPKKSGSVTSDSRE